MALFSRIVLMLSISVAASAEIANFHALTDQIFRSAAPQSQAGTLPQAGFTHVLIFKNELNNEVGKEVKALQKAGIPAANIYHIPFKWKDMDPIEDSCDQVVTALGYLVQIEKSKSHKILFHCTQGEDRTGALAGLYRMLYYGWSVDRTFVEEMCALGYEAGDKGKPAAVVKAVREEVTPVFLAVASLILDGKLSFKNVNPKVCKAGGLTSSPTFMKLMSQRARYVCR